MKKASQYVLALLFFFLIFELIIISPADVKDEPAPVEAESRAAVTLQSDKIDQSMSEIHMIQTHNESKEWELWADTAIGFKNQKELNIKKVKVNFFTANGISFDVTGDSGMVMPESKNMTIDGRVVTRSSNGYTFKTSTAEYNSAVRTLKSNTPVEVAGPRDDTGKYIYISGDLMNADLNGGMVSIERNVRAKKNISDEKQMAIIAEKVQLSGREKTLRFLGNVTIDLNGVRIKGPDALFNYDQTTKELKSIDLSGGVKVSDLSKWATSDNLKIDLAKNEFEFLGRPRVVQDNDEVSGDRILFLDGGKKVKVQNAKIKVSKESMDSNKQDKK
jgi:LPS export ABC transporter protein LptC